MAGSNGDDGQINKQAAAAMMVADDDDLFELDIDLLGLGDDDFVIDESRHRRGGGHDVADADDGHALLANCLLPVRSLSGAVPVAAGSVDAWTTSSSYPYSGYGYYSPRSRLFPGGAGAGGGSKRFLFGRSARFCFSSRGFETMGNYYFQRY